MMTDLYDPSTSVGDGSLDDMMLYSEIPADSTSPPDSNMQMAQNFAFDPSQMTSDQIEEAMFSSEGFHSNYIPQSTESHISAMQAYASYDPSQQVSYSAPQYDQNAFPWGASTSSPAAPATMTEFFHMMSQPENVQAYMDFLQTQQEQVPQAPPQMAPLRSRSNSNPISSSLPSAFSLRPSSTEAPHDASLRDKKLAKYRTKRARRLTGSQITSNDSVSTPVPNTIAEGVEGDRWMPSPKMPKTMTHELENRLMSSEEEVKMLRSALESRETELHMLHQFLYEEQQYQQWAMHNFGDASSNASSSTATSPRPHSPSTPAMVSSPSSISLGSSTMDADFTSLDTSSIGSDHIMEVMAANQRRQEKLKQLGGPPSDVYHPWWNGIPLNHPAFSQKEDWQHFELRPQERLAHERLNYFLMMQRYRMEQGSGTVGTSVPGSSMVDPNGSPYPSDGSVGDVSQILSSNENAHAASSSFYQSPHHHSHIMTGSPAQGSGFWSGHFAPANAEKIDFSKVSLRKTSFPPGPPVPSGASMSNVRSPGMSSNRLAPPPHSSLSKSSSAAGSSSPHNSSMVSPRELQESPTAAIWRDAMAHPEMHRIPSRQLSWLQEQATAQPSQQGHLRVPFRRTAAPSTTASHNGNHNKTAPTPPSPQQQLLQQQLQQQLHIRMQQSHMQYSPTNSATSPTSPLPSAQQNAARRIHMTSSSN